LVIGDCKQYLPADFAQKLGDALAKAFALM
jgi:hypothetical protein